MAFWFFLWFRNYYSMQRLWKIMIFLIRFDLMNSGKLVKFFFCGVGKSLLLFINFKSLWIRTPSQKKYYLNIILAFYMIIIILLLNESQKLLRNYKKLQGTEQLIVYLFIAEMIAFYINKNSTDSTVLTNFRTIFQQISAY